MIKCREHFRNYIAIRHTKVISRAIEFDDSVTAGNALTAKVKELLEEDVERNYMVAMYNNKV